jgi:hypothetical protein
LISYFIFPIQYRVSQGLFELTINGWVLGEEMIETLPNTPATPSLFILDFYQSGQELAQLARFPNQGGPHLSLYRVRDPVVSCPAVPLLGVR